MLHVKGLTIEQYNKHNDSFNIFYEAMRYIKKKIYIEEEGEKGKEKESSIILPKLILLLNVIKNFNKFDMFHKITVNTNNVNVIKFRNNILITTPFALALLCVTNCVRKHCKHFNMEYKYAELIKFFIDNDDNFQLRNDKTCIEYFIRNFSFLTRFIPRNIYL